MADLFDDQASDNRLSRPLAQLLDQAPDDWRPVIDSWRSSPTGRALVDHVEQRRLSGATIYPADPLRALRLTPLANVRVVILGQDPYHGPGQAEGLAFSVPQGIKPPPSLRNIFVELQREFGGAMPRHGHLGHWARQGVLLLNASLTVEDGLPASHAKRGWEALTDALVGEVASQERRIAFLLWGSHAQAKAPLIEKLAPGRHLLLCANHPSPLSARRPPQPFIGCGHWRALEAEGVAIDWMGVSAEGT